MGCTSCWSKSIHGGSFRQNQHSGMEPWQIKACQYHWQHINKDLGSVNWHVQGHLGQTLFRVSLNPPWQGILFVLFFHLFGSCSDSSQTHCQVCDIFNRLQVCHKQEQWHDSSNLGLKNLATLFFEEPPSTSPLGSHPLPSSLCFLVYVFLSQSVFPWDTCTSLPFPTFFASSIYQWTY